MIVFNPAAHFYFSTCLRLDDNETELHHSILESLTRENNSPDEVLNAIKNIILCDAPFQIYSFSFALIQISKLDKNQPAVKTILRKYKEIFTSLYGDQSKIASNLFDKIVDIAKEEDVSSELIHLSELTYSFHTDIIETESNFPYIDIVEFGAEAITLGLLNHFCENQETSNALNTYLEEKQSCNLNFLIEKCYSHQRGRACFLSSVELKRKLQLIESKEQFSQLIWRNTRISSSPDLEPDLVYLFLSYWFVYLDNKNTEDEKIKNILHEMSGFNLYAHLIFTFNNRAGRDEFIRKNFSNYLQLLFGREINSNAHFFEKISISTNLWLGSFYLIIAECFELNIAKATLLKLWDPIKFMENGIRFTTKFETVNENVAKWINSKSGGDPRAKKSQKNNLKILSPWLTWDASQQYIEIESYSHWLRTLYAVKVSKTILIKSKPNSNNTSFAYYLVHVSDLISSCREPDKIEFLETDRTNEKSRTQFRFDETARRKPHLTKLLLIINRDVNKLIGGNTLTQVPLDYFFSLLTEKTKIDNWLYHFQHKIISKTLYNWIYYNSLESAFVNLDSKNQNDNFRQLESISTDRDIISGIRLLRIFLHDDESARSGDYKNEIEKILLAKVNSVSDIRIGETTQGFIATIIRRFHFAITSGVSSSKQYIDDLLELLKSIRNVNDISYLNRFALISLFNDFEKINENNKDVFKFSIEVLFELNGLLDINIIGSKIISKISSLSDYQFSQAQIDVLNCFSNSVSISLKYNIYERNNAEKAIDPIKNAQQNQKIQLLRYFLNSIQYVANVLNKQLKNKVKIYNYYPAKKSRFDIFETDVSVRNNIPHFNLPNEYESNIRSELSLITYNTVEQTAQFYVQDIPLPNGTLNFFELTEDEKADILTKTNTPILLLAKCVGEVRDGSQIKYKFQIDNTTFESQALRGHKIKAGELIQLKYWYSHKFKQWFIDNNHCIPISDAKEDTLPTTSILIKNVSEFKRYNLPLNYWLPSYSDIFTGHLSNQISTGGILIVVGEDQKPRFSFLTSLINIVSDITETVSLTFIGMEWDTDRQEHGYLFYQALGLNYLIFEDEISFTNPNNYTFAEFLISEVSEDDSDIGTLNGLIVSFRLSFRNLRINLELEDAKNVDLLKKETRYPYLKVPFDDRNIRWRTMFDDSEGIEFTARNEKGNWICVLDEEWVKLGFNKSITVDLNRDFGRMAEVDFLLEKGWSNDGGRFNFTISGEVIERRGIDIKQLNKYLLLLENDSVEVTKPLKLSPKSYNVPCLTRDDFLVNLNLEELTFLPVDKDEQSFARALQNRNTVIARISPWKKNDIELKISNFPANKIQDHYIEAYFTEVPKIKDQGVGSCLIVIKDSQNEFSEELKIEIENISHKEIQKSLSVYAKLEGVLINNQWRFSLYTRQIFLKTSWKFKRVEDDDFKNYFFLGTTLLNNELHYLFERKNEWGILYFTNQIDENVIKNELYNSVNSINTNWVSQPLNNVRIGFAKQGMIITGGIKNKVNLDSSQTAFLNQISFNCTNLRDQEYFVKRNFTITAIQQQIKESKPQLPQLKERENEKRAIQFEAYFENPYEINGIINKENLNILITNSKKGMRWIPDKDGWINILSLASNASHSISDLVFVPSAVSNYNLKDATFWLAGASKGKFFPTFKLGQKSVDDLFERYEYKLDETIDVTNSKIYFYDKEKIHPFTKLEHDEEMYRFEEGFGKNILIPTERILYQGKPIKTAELIFFPSDGIKKFNFLKDPDTQIIKFNILLTEISQAHRLYLQAKNHNIYHLAHVACDKNGPYIKHVKGVDENSIKDGNMTSIYDRIHATFDETSSRTLKSRFESDSESRERIILVKVDTFLFGKTGKLQFNHYKLTYIADKESPDTRTIQENARIIMELGTIGITASGNDYFVRVRPNQLLDKIDVGQDFQDGRILRREFSLNEALLREYYRRDDRRYFDGFEVYLTVSSYGKNQVSYSLVQNSVFRKQDVLYAFKGNSIVCIANGKFTTTQDLVIEVKPGNFLKLHNNKLIFNEINAINEGDILSITIKQDMTFMLENAVAGDYRFLENNRKVVVLPKDSVFKNPLRLSRFGSTPYTIGELPNIELDFQNIDITRRNNFLLQHHPKIACINKNTYNGKEQIFLKLRFEDELSVHGHIQIDEKRNTLNLVPSQEKIDVSREISWSNATFYDGSIKEIFHRIKKCRWKYHDEQSKDLTKKADIFEEGEAYELLPSKILEAVDCISGPLFFERRFDNINLRYSTLLFQWAYPVSSLIDFLDYCKDKYTFAYAGKQGNIHFIEAAPGRIFELPVNLLVLKAGIVEISIKNYAWNFLNVGDKITIRNVTGDLSDIYKVELISIEHSIRTILTSDFKTSISRFDKNQGLLEIGASLALLKLPISNNTEEYAPNKTICFNPRRNEISQKKINLEDDNIILIALSEKDTFYPIGYPEVHPQCFEYAQRNVIREMIKKVGNALPAIIFKKSKDGNWFFKRLSLENVINQVNNKVLFCEVVDALNESYQDLIIKIGGYFEIIPYNDVISGVPDEHRKYVTPCLIGKRIWFRVNFNSTTKSIKLIAGLAEDHLGSEISVTKIIDVVTDTSQLLGTICKANSSQKIHWLPETEMAWCNVKPEIADYVFYTGGDSFTTKTSSSIKVKVSNQLSGNYISRIRTTELLSAFRKKRCGSDNIDVLVVNTPSKSSETKYSFIGYSVLHKTLLYCVIFDEPNALIPRQNEMAKTEVIEKEFLNLKIKTLYGNRKILLHIPLYSNDLSELKETKIDNVISKYYHLNNVELKHQGEQIKGLCNSISTYGITDAISMKSGFMLLELVCKLQNANEEISYLSEINWIFELLKLNLLRHVSIEILNQEKPHEMEDHYLDLILQDSLKPFYFSQDVFVTELDLLKFKKNALTLCFSQGKKYRAIGNSILQTVGHPSHLDNKILSNSNLYKFHKLINDYSLKGSYRIEKEFINLIKEIILWIETNRIEIKMLREVLLQDDLSKKAIP